MKVRKCGFGWPAIGAALVASGVVLSPAAAADQYCNDPRAPRNIEYDSTYVRCVGINGQTDTENASYFGYYDGGAGQLINVANGSTIAESRDAVNGGQLNLLGSSLASALGGGASFNPSNGQISAPSLMVGGTRYSDEAEALGALDARTSSQIAEMRFDLSRLSRAQRAGEARTAALAGIPQAMRPGANMIGGSMGGSGSAVAFAIGASRAFGDDHTIAKAAASYTTQTSRVTWTVGAGYQF